MNNFKRVSAAALAGATLVLASGTSHGMGFGRPVSRAILGEPLRVSVPLRLEAGETIDAECVQVEVHFGESKLSSSQVQVYYACQPRGQLSPLACPGHSWLEGEQEQASYAVCPEGRPPASVLNRTLQCSASL